jgi:YidC/Oxa1 family membrane protein insertase
VKAKHEDDQQAQQMETMKMYREYGVNPLGGCLPMALQMPIWFALVPLLPGRHHLPAGALPVGHGPVEL